MNKKERKKIHLLIKAREKNKPFSWSKIEVGAEPSPTEAAGAATKDVKGIVSLSCSLSLSHEELFINKSGGREDCIWGSLNLVTSLDGTCKQSTLSLELGCLPLCKVICFSLFNIIVNFFKKKVFEDIKKFNNKNCYTIKWHASITFFN